MTTLQKTFRYGGDVKASPIEAIQLSFRCPMFEYTYDPAAENKQVTRNLTGYDISLLKTRLDVNKYLKTLDPTNFTGKDTVSALLFYYSLLQLRTTNNGLIDLDSLSATIHVSMSGEKGGTIGDEDIDVLYFCKKLMETQNVAGAIDHPAAMLANNAGDNAANYERLKELLIQNVFLINKSAFQALSVEFRQATQLNDFQLLLVIAKFAEIRGEGNLGDMTPVLASQLNGLIPETTFQVMIPLVNKFYKKLFDFPILVPEIKQQALEVAGNVHFIVDNGVTISKKDFSHYTLSVEYASEDAGDFGVMYYDWSKNADAVDQNSLKFSLPQTDKIVRYGFPGTVTVVVKDFNGVMVWTHDYKQSDEALKRVQIDIPLERPLELTPQDNNVPDNNVKKLRGQLVALAKECVVDQVTVVIQAKKEGDEIWRIVGAATTDRSGYFFTPYPTGHFLATQALLSINPDKPIDIALNEVPDGDNMPDFLYLLADEADCTPPADTEEDDCECGTVKKPKRLPDQEDLISSDEYTQDMGAGCMNLTTPNRTLREYEHQAIVHLSDPDVANYTLEKYTDKQGNVKYTLTGGATTIKRSIINLQNPIHWQDSPGSGSNLSLYQAVSVATGHILHYKSVFKADGYSLGEVLYSLPLAPGQKKQIVIFDSSHSLTGAESQFITQGESLSANLVNDRAITDQLSGSLAELLSGQSDASTSGVSAGLGAAASMGSFGASLGVAGGYANSNSSASQNSSRDTAQFFAEKLRQSIMQNASSYRQLNANVVTTVREGQQYAATTESVANHNHCHAVTMMYFEVLRHYAIFQELAYVEECVFVPLLMTNFTAQNISKWKDVLAARLLPVPSSTYLQPMLIMGKGRQHPLIRAFDANERILTNYANVEYPTGRYADERMTEIKGQIRIRINIPRPKTRFDRILSFPVIKKTITSQGDVDVAGTISDNIKDSVIGAIVPCAAKGPSIKYQTNSTDVLTRGQIFDAFMTLDANYENVPPAQCIRVNFESVEIFEPPFWGLFFQGDVTQTNMDFFAGMTKEKELWTSYATILGISVKELFKYFNNNVVSDWDRIFNDNIAPMIVEKLVRESTLRFNPLGVLDITPLEKYHGGDRIMTFNLQGFTSLTRAAVDKIQVIFTPNITGSQKDTFFNYVDFNLASLTLNYSTNFSHGTILSSSSVNDLRDNAEFLTPLNSEEKRNPRNEDKVLVRQLLDHLNSNLEYYNKLLWYNLDPDRRFMLLDGFSIQIFDDLGSPGAYRSLASVVKNQLITVTGNSLVFPVASGYKVSPSFITAVNPENGDTEQVSLLDHYKPRTPVPPYRVSVPTRGVYLEAIQGVCDSCEKVKPNSSQDWNKFPVDEPTAILPISTPTPAITDWKAAFKDFAAPMINIQNAPAAPDPGAGLAGLNELLGKSGIFADVTGLQGNQQNALKTYLSNNENVRAMAEMAKGLAMQQHNTQNAQGITDSINQARSTGAISAEDQSRLTREHLQQQIDGGDQARLDAQAAREQSRPSLSDAAIQAAAQGRTVAAQRTDSDGNSESVNITDTAAAASGGINVAYDVPTLQQPSSLLCWATAATMMMNWKNRSSSAIPNVLRDAGLNLTPPDENRYTAMFTANQGLASAQKEQFITALGMLGEAPASYPLQQYVLWLRTYGPLWITTDSSTATGSFSPHAKILKKIVGPADQEDAVQFTFNDPASGNEVTQSFRDFIASYEQMVTDNPGDLFIQIVHFRDAVPAGEGQDGGVSTPARSWMTGVPSTGMTTVKSTMSTQASSEYTYWHDAGTHTGSAWWETDTDTHVVARMTAYWTSAFNTDAEGTATSQVSATDAATKITNRDSWSAAFISYIVSKAGILANTIFSHSIRHVDFIAKAILNKEGRVFSNPFWGYAPGDYAPAVGDIVGRSSQVNYANVVDRSNRQVRRAESHSDVVVEVHDDHIIVIGGNLELDAVHTAFTGGAWHNDITAAAQTNVSVGKRKIYTENGKIKPTGIWEIMNNAGAVQFTGPQSDYFVVIKVRTDVNRT